MKSLLRLSFVQHRLCIIYLAIIHTGFAVGARTSSAQWSNACTGVRINATPIPAVGIIDQFDGFVFDGSGR